MIKLKNILLEKKELDSKHVKQLAIFTDQNHHTLGKGFLHKKISFSFHYILVLLDLYK